VLFLLKSGPSGRRLTRSGPLEVFYVLTRIVWRLTLWVALFLFLVWGIVGYVGR